MLIVPPVTPFKNDAVDPEAVAQLVEFYVRHRVPKLFPLGTTGEFPMLSVPERMEALEAFVGAAGGRLEVIAHIGAAALREAIRLGEHAGSLGVRSVAAVTPFYFGYSQEGLEGFYQAVCMALPELQVYAYTIPSRAGNTLEAATLERLSALPNLVGIKDSSGDMNRLLALLDIPRLTVFAGADGLALPFLRAGGKGLVSGLGGAIPEVYVAFARVLETGDSEAQERLYHLIRKLNALLLGGSRLDYIRIALEWRGLATGESRAPLPSAGPGERAALFHALDTFALEAERVGVALERPYTEPRA